MSEDESFGSDDDMLSPGGSNSARTTFANEDEKRAHHNALERKRRDHIKHSFNSLRDAVPNLDADSGKVSRAEILKRASEYIKTMRKRNSNHQQDIQDLQRQNRSLEVQINSLQNCRENPHPAAASALAMANLNGATSDDETDSGMSGDEEQLRKRIKTC
ncbi:protein max-like [Tropilaelaps mercedesae]|uniref:Protein max-like n=1 Tax=Tropilaelaps mercedesae TaxID=418985 RepID=A0A1V9XAD5_9ACAR|nr:protein max-like [Tropilaelaps mercedesae]